MAAIVGFMTHITCRLTAKNRDQLRNPTLGNRIRATFFPFRTYHPLSLSSYLSPLFPHREEFGKCSKHAAGFQPFGVA